MAIAEQGKAGMAWPVAAMTKCGYQLSAQSRTGYRAVGNSEMCSRRLAALPNTQADGGSVHCATVDGVGRERLPCSVASRSDMMAEAGGQAHACAAVKVNNSSGQVMTGPNWLGRSIVGCGYLLIRLTLN